MKRRMKVRDAIFLMVDVGLLKGERSWVWIDVFGVKRLLYIGWKEMSIFTVLADLSSWDLEYRENTTSSRAEGYLYYYIRNHEMLLEGDDMALIQV